MPQGKKKPPQNPKSHKPSKTVDCQSCGEAIIVPERCQHGKKLANCHGTGCITAHITNHNKVCTHQIAKSKTTTTTAERKAMQKEHAILTSLVKQELQNIEKIRGRDFQYLKGIPKAEILQRIDCMGLEDLRELAQQLKGVGDGKTTVDEAMYDDEESDDDAATKIVCHTPPPEEE